MDPRRTARLTDAARMRVLAHPTRLRLLALLRERGPQTAALLGEAVGEAPGTVSYHLSRLASAALIEESPGESADRRERWWRARHDATSWEPAELLGDPDRLAASSALQSAVGAFYAQSFERYIAALPQLPAAWVSAAVSTDRMLRLTADELAALSAELTAVAERWDAVSDAHADGDGAEPVTLVVQAYRRP